MYINLDIIYCTNFNIFLPKLNWIWTVIVLKLKYRYLLSSVDKVMESNGVLNQYNESVIESGPDLDVKASGQPSVVELWRPTLP